MAMWDGYLPLCDQLEAQRRAEDLFRNVYINSLPGLGRLQAPQNALDRAAVSRAPEGERAQEQIIADCEAAYAELLADIERKRAAEDAAQIEAEKPKCVACLWHTAMYPSGVCRHPLVKGLGASHEAYDHGYWGRNGKAKLCGPEKALWEPKLRLWEKIFDWVEEKCNYLLARLRNLF